MQPLILIGGGGHCKSCIDVIGLTGRYTICGILDTADKVGSDVLGIPIIGTDDDLLKWVGKAQFLIAVGQISSPDTRIQISKKLDAIDAELATIKSPRAYVSKYATIRAGTIIMHNAFVNADACIGRHCIINTGAVIEHDVIIGETTHISTGAHLNGNIHVGDESFIGSQATINHGVSLPKRCIIGSGSVITSSLNNSGTFVGVPGRKIK